MRLPSNWLRDDDGLEMRVVVGSDPDLRARQAGFDEGLDFGGIHDGKGFGERRDCEY